MFEDYDEQDIGNIILALQEIKIAAEAKDIADIQTNGSDELVVSLSHSFTESPAFPDLQEKLSLESVSPPVGLSDLEIGYGATLNISMVESGAGFHNTLGAYTVGADGTIYNAEFAFTNVKDPLRTDKDIQKLERKIDSHEKRIENLEKNIDKSEGRIENFKSRQAEHEQKISELEQKIIDDPARTAKYERQIAGQENRIARLDERIAAQESRIDGFETRIDAEQQSIAELNGEIGGLTAGRDFSYTLDADYGTEAGFFIIANGDRKNDGYEDLDLENGTVEFVYDLGGENERLAKVSDSAEDISIVYTNGEETVVLKGHVYHSTSALGGEAINPDGAAHAIAGLADADDPGTLRIGFEDLKNLGDADFNDVVFDVSVDGVDVTLPGEVLGADILGTESDDVLVGTDESEVIVGRGGDDLIKGSAGSDTLRGGEGADTADYSAFETGIAANLASQSAQALVLLAEQGGDTASGTDTFESIENVIGTAFSDVIEGDNGDNVLSGGAGDDLLNGGAGNDTADYGSAGAGVFVDIRAGSASDDGEGGTDTLLNIENIAGSSYDDVLGGGNGDSVLRGGAGDDGIYGRAGDDWIYGGAGGDTIYGDAGFDTVDYSEDPAAVFVDLRAKTATDGYGDTDFIGGGIEQVIGTAWNDVIGGDNLDNVIRAGAGDDSLYGRGGNDLFIADAGNDLIYGDDGFDTIDYSSAGSGIFVDIRAGTAQDGFGGTDTIASVEEIIGGAYDDVIGGSDGVNDVLRGGAGDDNLHGRGGDDTLYGGEGLNALFGDGGNDTLYGGVHHETLRGGDGDDTLVSGLGRDELYGEAGADTFVFAEAGLANHDWIRDFDAAEGDALDISALLDGFDETTDDINDFVELVYASSTKTTVYVNADGAGDDAEAVASFSADMSGVTVDSMILDGSLIV